MFECIKLYKLHRVKLFVVFEVKLKMNSLVNQCYRSLICSFEYINIFTIRNVGHSSNGVIVYLFHSIFDQKGKNQPFSQQQSSVDIETIFGAKNLYKTLGTEIEPLGKNLTIFFRCKLCLATKIYEKR